MTKNLFIFDENKCVGCHACILACINENGWQPDPWRNVANSNPTHHPDLPLFYLSMACNHCEEAPCMYHCPSLAFRFDPKTGAIDHQPELCIGCKYCTWACPYDAPKFIADKGIIEKCTFCAHRIEDGQKPACASLCPTGALDFAKEEFTAEDSLASSPVPVSVGSSLRVIKAQKRDGPRMDKTLSGIPEGIPATFPIRPRITAAKEWPLFSFSLLTSIACALYFSKGSLGNLDWLGWLIPVLGILAAILSLLHLGKKWRAWRAVLNIERSWLSREILFFIFFLAAVVTDYFFHDLPDAVGIVNGILLLISIDMLYQPAMWKWKFRFHSAQVLFIALSLWLLLAGFDILFILFTTFRSGLYTLRRAQTGHANRKYVLVSLARIWLPLVAIIVLLSTEALLPVVILTLVTDGIDRWMFYGDLRVAGEGSRFARGEDFAQRRFRAMYAKEAQSSQS